LRPHRTSRREIEDLLRLAERDVRDAAVEGLSTDRRFMIAYESDVALATIPLYAEGFRTQGAGHHQTIFLALPLIMGGASAELAEYFDTCRSKRNVGAYDHTGGTSEAEVEDLLAEVGTFREQVLAWLEVKHPVLVG
jgi:hypothetical protein